MKLSLRGVSYRYGKDFRLAPVSMDITEPVTALIGPNGAGKSTLVKCMTGVLPARGSMTFGEEAEERVTAEFIRAKVSYLPQSGRIEAGITVFETVLLGLMEDLSLSVTTAQADAVELMLDALELDGLARRPLRKLSGGQAQMVLLAQALIKRPKILILDEPLNNLDVHRQFVLLDLIASLSASGGMLTLIVMHDIPLAARYADRIAVMHRGGLYGYGSPGEVLTPSLMRDVYRLETAVHRGARGKPVLEFLDISRDEAEESPFEGETYHEAMLA